MKKSILIVENNKELTDVILSGCSQSTLAGLDIYVAKTPEAATALLRKHSNMEAILIHEDENVAEQLDDRAISYTEDNLEKVFSILESRGLLNKGKDLCPRHEAMQTQVTDLSYRLKAAESLLDSTKAALKLLKAEVKTDIDAVNASINDCPVKKGLIEKALAAKPKTEDKPDKTEGPSKAIIAGLLTLIGVIITAGATIVSEIMKILGK